MSLYIVTSGSLIVFFFFCWEYWEAIYLVDLYPWISMFNMKTNKMKLVIVSREVKVTFKKEEQEL